jgi:hypothetical protein
VGKPEGKSHLEDPGVDGWIILSWMKDMDWIDLSKDRDRWQALVKVVMNLQVP